MEIKDIIIDVDILDLKNKEIKTIDRSNIKFFYRSSELNDVCILGGRIKLERGKRRDIATLIDTYLKKREWIQSLNFPSAGSVFKNPDKENPAGKLIEACGLKGKRIGGAEISKMHANFIVNRGGALYKDVESLIDLAKRKVKEQFNIDLELELNVK